MRFTSKGILLLICLVFALVIGAYWQVQGNNRTAAAKPVVVPTLTPVSTLVSLGDEDSGILLTEKLLAAKQGGSRTVKIIYRSGHTGVFFLDSAGRIIRFEAYGSEENTDTKQNKVFEAAYFPDTGLIKSARTFSAAGLVESTVERSAAGEECRRSLRPDGTLVSQTVISRDGSQVTQEYDARGTKVVSEHTVQATERTYYLPAADPALGGFNITACGTRMISWQCLDSDGNIVNTGEVDEQGRLIISMFINTKNMEGVYKQVWRPVMEDWHRRYYALELVEKYPKPGVLDLDILFAGDGKRPAAMRNYFGERKIRCLVLCDERGYIMKYSLFDDKGKVAYEAVIPEAQREPIPGLGLVVMPFWFGDGKTPAYRLSGTPFALPLKDNDQNQTFVSRGNPLK